MVEVVNSALSLWAKFHSTFPSSKSRSQKWKKVWFSAGRRNDSCSPWRCDVHQGEGEGWRLEWPWTSTIRVCLSLSYPQHFPLPCQAGIAGYHSTRNWPPPTARVHCQGTNITVAWKPKMPPGCGDVNRGANQPHPSSPWPVEGGCPGAGRRVLIPARSFGIQGDISMG